MKKNAQKPTKTLSLKVIKNVSPQNHPRLWPNQWVT